MGVAFPNETMRSERIPGAIWERDLGILHRYMVSPAPHSALVFGEAIGAAIRGLVEAVIIYILAVLMGIDVDLSPPNILGVIALIALGSALFSMFSLIIACLVKTRERFMGIGQVLTMPIFFASNAIYPIALMPNWLKVISSANPLTYEVDALRALMIVGGQSQIGIARDFAVLVIVGLVFLLIAARLYPRMTSLISTIRSAPPGTGSSRRRDTRVTGCEDSFSPKTRSLLCPTRWPAAQTDKCERDW